MYDTEKLYLSIYDYMEKAFPIPNMTYENEDTVLQIVAGRTAIEEFLSQMYDNPDIAPERILLELELKMEKESFDNLENGFVFHAAFEALEEIAGVFFMMGTDEYD